MKDIIRSIIEEIPSNMIFDTHTVIEYLLQKKSDDYLAHYKGNSTETYHGNIGQNIAKLADEGLVDRMGDSWSLNIHKTFSKCACWKKR